MHSLLHSSETVTDPDLYTSNALSRTAKKFCIPKSVLILLLHSVFSKLTAQFIYRSNSKAHNIT